MDAGPRGPATARLLAVARWLPAATAAVYLGSLATQFPSLVRAVYWNSDMAAPFVVAADLRGEGHVVIPHFGNWTSLGWLLATRGVPGHTRIWEATGYAFALLGAAAVGWTAWRVGGRWAGVTAASICVIVGPTALLALLTVNLHGVPPFLAATLAAYLVATRDLRSTLVAAVVGVFAGLSVASDPLTLLAAVVPFVCAAAVLARLTRSRALAVRTTVLTACCGVVAVATEGTMRLLGFWVTRPPTDLIGARDALHNVVRLGRFVALAGGANYVLPGGRYPVAPLRALITALVLAAVGATLWLAVRETARRADPARTALAVFWAVAVVAVGLAFVVSRQGLIVERPGAFYVVAFVPAAAMGVSLLAARSLPAQALVAIGVAVVGAANVIAVRDGRVERPPNALRAYAQPLLGLLESKGVTKGYAGYWDAQSLSWKSGLRLQVAPVQLCGRAGGDLCPHREWIIESWFRPRPGPSFVLVDPETEFVPRAPRLAAAATGRYRFGPLVLYLFANDVASRLGQD